MTFRVFTDISFRSIVLTYRLPRQPQKPIRRSSNSISTRVKQSIRLWRRSPRPHGRGSSTPSHPPYRQQAPKPLPLPLLRAQDTAKRTSHRPSPFLSRLTFRRRFAPSLVHISMSGRGKGRGSGSGMRRRGGEGGRSKKRERLRR